MVALDTTTGTIWPYCSFSSLRSDLACWQFTRFRHHFPNITTRLYNCLNWCLWIEQGTGTHTITPHSYWIKNWSATPQSSRLYLKPQEIVHQKTKTLISVGIQGSTNSRLAMWFRGLYVLDASNITLSPIKLFLLITYVGMTAYPATLQQACLQQPLNQDTRLYKSSPISLSYDVVR